MLWFSGLSGAGKTTLADALTLKLKDKINLVVLDGDKLRSGLCRDLKFSNEDRKENIRRSAEIAKLLLKQNYSVISALITPLQEHRDVVNSVLNGYTFKHIWVKCPLDVCEKRDVKGLYKKARAVNNNNFTGLGSTFEDPINSDIVVETDHHSIAESVNYIIDYLIKENLLK